MKGFCKIFQCEKNGQILIKIDACDEHKPEVRIYFNPEGLGVCSIAFGFNDDDEGWNKAEKAFNDMQLEDISDIITNAISQYT